MMVLHPAAGTPSEHQTKFMKAPLRKRKSSTKGTIAGFTFGKDGVVMSPQEPSSELPENVSHHASPVNGTNQPQPAPDTSATVISKPCHSARLALMCTQNALRMGARTQLHLCPPGRPRRELRTALRQRPRSHPHLQNNGSRRFIFADTSGGYYGLDKFVGEDTLEEYDMKEEDVLIGTASSDADSDEEASSGDEDELQDVDEFFSDEAPPLDDEDRYTNLREPLYTPVQSNPNGPPVTAVSFSGKLPFNRRKLHYFDSITANESAQARDYVRQEFRRSKRRANLVLARHLRRTQQEDKRKKKLERGESTEEASVSDKETQEEKELMEAGVSRLEGPVSPALAAALVVESLSFSKRESIEGMSKCYDGIVAAGVALLDAQSMDPTTPISQDEKASATRSEIMATLEPLLITSLESPSGDTILMLARLRRMCGTLRYQRRFVQRIAPALIRPPDSAMWCLRHQNDMEAILAAAELIFDAAFDIFSKGWYEKGQLLLADSKRAETLNTAATQLRNLSSDPTESLSIGLSGHTHNNRRRMMNASKKGMGGDGSDGLAEWEVIAVDRQIRISISSVFSTDWSRPTPHVDPPRHSYRRASKRPSALPSSSSVDMSPKNLLSSPRSPTRSSVLGNKAPASPPELHATVSSSSGENMTGSAGPSSSDRPLSPPPHKQEAAPASRLNAISRDTENKAPGSVLADEGNPKSASTPPISPKSPIRSQIDVVRMPDPLPTLTPLSPKRGSVMGNQSSGLPQSGSSNTPLSPSSVGTAASNDVMSYRPVASTAASVSSASGPPAHYRMLTSTAAERKRTVAACRALRAQIQRFEDAFIQLHGRAPKGAAERAPLATTYAQYREWKRAIRADAACRIQALFRGAYQRWRLRRTNDARLIQVVLKKAGRPGYSSDSNAVSHISLPSDFGRSDETRAGSTDSLSLGDSTRVGQPLVPHWSNPNGRRPPSSSGDSYSSRGIVPDSLNLSLAELQARKRDLKQQLKQYDMSFARKHGRMPVKAEKEPIRHLYEQYNSLKNQISMMERDRDREIRQTQSASPASIPTVFTSRTQSPTSESVQSGDDTTTSSSSPLPAKPRRRVPSSMSASTQNSAGSSSQDLDALRAEKSKLHQMLRSFEKEFFKENDRQVSSFADIKPVAAQYRRYKEIKKAIAALQQQNGER